MAAPAEKGRSRGIFRDAKDGMALVAYSTENGRHFRTPPNNSGHNRQ